MSRASLILSFPNRRVDGAKDRGPACCENNFQEYDDRSYETLKGMTGLREDSDHKDSRASKFWGDWSPVKAELELSANWAQFNLLCKVPDGLYIVL